MWPLEEIFFFRLEWAKTSVIKLSSLVIQTTFSGVAGISLLEILLLKEGQAAGPRRPLFPAIGSAERTAQIVRALVFL